MIKLLIARYLAGEVTSMQVSCELVEHCQLS